MRTGIPATHDAIVRALIENHGFTLAKARAAAAASPAIVEQAVAYGSFVSYILDDLLAAVGHECTDACKSGDEDDEL